MDFFTSTGFLPVVLLLVLARLDLAFNLRVHALGQRGGELTELAPDLSYVE